MYLITASLNHPIFSTVETVRLIVLRSSLGDRRNSSTRMQTLVNGSKCVAESVSLPCCVPLRRLLAGLSSDRYDKDDAVNIRPLPLSLLRRYYTPPRAPRPYRRLFLPRTQKSMVRSSLCIIRAIHTSASTRAPRFSSGTVASSDSHPGLGPVA